MQQRLAEVVRAELQYELRAKEIIVGLRQRRVADNERGNRCQDQRQAAGSLDLGETLQSGFRLCSDSLYWL